jgi:RNA polymerase sigma-70 factor (ECF subfamily)
LNAVAERQKPPALSDDLERLFREHHGLVYRAAYRITGRAEDAEDVLQTLFVRLLRRDRLPDLSLNAKGYLHRAAVNLALDTIKARKQTVQSEEEATGSWDAGWEMRETIRAALAALHPKAAEIFVLRHVEGYSNGEIAVMIGTSAGVVAVTLFRARMKLKRTMRTQMGKRRNP